ncbi:MAG: transglutaminase-like domain-containing protein [Oscillospiraceae bacterium]|nr:transglutaminase-like domain-containing protein [Oscillospiraceae bacterium]
MKRILKAAILPLIILVIIGIIHILPAKTIEILPTDVPAATPRGGAETRTPAPSADQAELNGAFTVPAASAPGTAVRTSGKAVIDYSNAADGYVMVKYQGEAGGALRTLIDAPNGVRYTYVLQPGDYAVYPLTEGDGEYTIGVYEQTEGSKYKLVVKAAADVSLSDPFQPFLRPSQYVNYSRESAVAGKAAELMADKKGLTDKIAAVYNFVIGNLTYDKVLARTVQSGYVPDVDAVLERKEGICFDYAAVMTAMLRSSLVPAKLVVGFTGDEYHAWINVYSEETGWINQVIFFDGQSWTLMDPTFASGRPGYTPVTANYEAKYQY